MEKIAELKRKDGFVGHVWNYEFFTDGNDNVVVETVNGNKTEYRTTVTDSYSLNCSRLKSFMLNLWQGYQEGSNDWRFLVGLNGDYKRVMGF